MYLFEENVLQTNSQVGVYRTVGPLVYVSCLLYFLSVHCGLVVTC